MKNRLLSILFAIPLLLIMTVGCNNENTVGDSCKEKDETTVETDENGDPIPEKKVIKAGFIYNDVLSESTLSECFENARLQLGKSLGIETCYLENITVSDFADAVDVLTSEEKCNLIVACSNVYRNSVATLARGDSSTHFVCYGGTKTMANLDAFQPQLYQAANVCGLTAEYNSKSNILGIVADSTMYDAYAVIDAYVLGAQELTASKTDVRLNWAYSFSDEQTKKSIDDLVSKGCDSIFIYQSNKFGIEYCEKIGVRVVGLGYNVPEIAPETYLTGLFPNMNTYLVDIVRSLQSGNHTAEICVSGLRSGGARMIELGKNTANGTADIVATFYDIVKMGKSNIFNGEIKSNYGDITVEKGSYLPHESIIEINWICKAVTQIVDYAEPREEIPESDFVVHK